MYLVIQLVLYGIILSVANAKPAKDKKGCTVKYRDYSKKDDLIDYSFNSVSNFTCTNRTMIMTVKYYNNKKSPHTVYYLSPVENKNRMWIVIKCAADQISHNKNKVVIHIVRPEFVVREIQCWSVTEDIDEYKEIQKDYLDPDDEVVNWSLEVAQ